jgi:hypothetical protein
MWARLQRWAVPELHVIICQWLETCTDPERVLLIFRGAAKSTLYAVYKAWKLYRTRTWRSLIYAADDKLAAKLTRDTLNVLRRHPLCGGMLSTKPGSKAFWVLGATDARNPSMEAVGVSSNATGSRTDDVDFDDIEVPKNIKTAEARENLRNKIEDSTHIAVPGAQFTYIGTPHTHNSIYTELIEGGAAVLKIPLFEHVKRYEETGTATRYAFGFTAGSDGLYVLAGIGKYARLLTEGVDYKVAGRAIVFDKPPGVVLDICARCAWPERFTRADIELRRRKTRTLNAWDSQYLLEAKPLTDIRLDPDKLRRYQVEPVVREANGEVAMYLGKVRIVGAVAYWDCSLGKLKSDASVLTLLLTDERGNLYTHRTKALTGELAKFDEKGVVSEGQCAQIRELVLALHIPCVEVETNGPGGFVPPILRRALAGTGCAVREVHNSVDKRKRILDAIEAPLSSRFLWVHVEVCEGPLPDQMRDFKPEVRDQEDDFLDSLAGAIAATPVRIGKAVKNFGGQKTKDWRPASGEYEVTLEL